MPRPNQFRLRVAMLVWLGLACAVAGVVGCGKTAKPAARKTLELRYPPLPAIQVPDYLKDTILERCELQDNRPMLVSGFGLVANLHGTGDTFAGTAVREYIRNVMIKRGLGSVQQGLENLQPDDILKDPRFSIVRVDGLIPPGARPQERFDIFVSALDGNNTTSLAHGDLYRTDLKINGANLQAPSYTMDIWANGEGAIFVNPAYVLNDGGSSQPEVRASLRRGSIPHGGVTALDRSMTLRLRQPQLSMARAVDLRINQRFQKIADKPTKNSISGFLVAEALDEARVRFYVPRQFNGDWEHFSQVVTHLFLDPSPEFAVVKARQLAEEAVKPDAPLLDISYCFEGLGSAAMPFIAPLMTHPQPDVAFAAARAAGFIGDGSAGNVLLSMARDSSHPFQINAVQTLAKLPPSPAVNQMLRELLDSARTTVRIEAYRALSANNDSSIISKPVNNRFRLDIVPSEGPPLIYASRTGMPRIAVIGNKPRLNLPVLFTAMQNRLSISSESDRPLVTVFYRGANLPNPVSFLSSPEAAELIARLGGEGAPGEMRIDFTYCEIVALLQAMSDQQRFWAPAGDQRLPVAFVLQEAPAVEQTIEEAPIIPEQIESSVPSQPQTEKLGAADLRMNGGK